MDFSKVDWWHVAAVGAGAALLGPVGLGALGLGAAAGALGLTGTVLGLGTAAVSTIGQAKGAAAK